MTTLKIVSPFTPFDRVRVSNAKSYLYGMTGEVEMTHVRVGQFSMVRVRFADRDEPVPFFEYEIERVQLGGASG